MAINEYTSRGMLCNACGAEVVDAIVDGVTLTSAAYPGLYDLGTHESPFECIKELRKRLASLALELHWGKK